VTAPENPSMEKCVDPSSALDVYTAACVHYLSLS
jgi:hypothetical protein